MIDFLFLGFSTMCIRDLDNFNLSQYLLLPSCPIKNLLTKCSKWSKVSHNNYLASLSFHQSFHQRWFNCGQSKKRRFFWKFRRSNVVTKRRRRKPLYSICSTRRQDHDIATIITVVDIYAKIIITAHSWPAKYVRPINHCM